MVKIATKVTNGLDLSSQRIQNLGTPSVDTDATTKAYVDSVARGLDWKQSVRAASTGNIANPLTGAPSTLDGVSLAANDRVLLKDQSTGSQNGIYSITTLGTGANGVWARASDADSDAEVTSGLALSVTEGSVNNDRLYVLTTSDPIVVGTTALVFSQLSGGGGTYTAGLGLSGTTTFDVGAGTGIVVGADTVSIDTNLVMRRFAANVGDGSATAVTITHSFGTRDVNVQVFTNASPWDSVLCDVTRPNTNDVTLTFATAPASGAYRCVIIG